MTAKRKPSLTRSESLSESWKERQAYTDGLHGTSFHNTWRAIVFTIKGKKAGCQESWKVFKNFKQDMYPTYKEGYRISRKYKDQAFSKENCEWVLPSDVRTGKTVQFEYNGQVKSLKEWCLEYDLALHGVRLRYFRNKDYSPHEILFGKAPKRKKPKIKDRREHEAQGLKDKASKMMSAYRHKDRKKGIRVDPLFTPQWLLENILMKNCCYCGTDKNVGADRLDNSKGHSLENIVPCCYRCNTVRQDHFSYEEMLKIGKFIRENIDNLRQTLPQNFTLEVINPYETT